VKSAALPTRHIIICVDGVGFATIRKMRAEGRFKAFRDPARMIAPFPSLTNVSIARSLGTRRRRGNRSAYEED